MIKVISLFSVGCALTFLISGCAGKQAFMTIDSGSAVPGTQVERKGATLQLLGPGLEVGQAIPDVGVIDAESMKPVNLRDYRGSVLFLSIVPSIDTKVCEAQTHYLGEQGDALPPEVKRITISRDTPFAQTRFAREARLEDVQYLSDYREGAFGRSIGLLIDDSRLLARAIILVDKEGIVQYIQVVPNISHLPDMEKAFAEATILAGRR